MIALLLATLTQSLTLIPLALGINLSYTLLRVTDMTIDGSFVLGAGVFAQLVTMGISPILAFLVALSFLMSLDPPALLPNRSQKLS